MSAVTHKSLLLLHTRRPSTAITKLRWSPSLLWEQNGVGMNYVEFQKQGNVKRSLKLENISGNHGIVGREVFAVVTSLGKCWSSSYLDFAARK